MAKTRPILYDRLGGKQYFTDLRPTGTAGEPEKTSLSTATYRPDLSFRAKVMVSVAACHSRQRCNLFKMFPSTRTTTGVPDSWRPLRRRWSARMTLVVGWVAFWLTTAFFPCCETFATAFDHHTDGVSNSVPAAGPAHHSGPTPRDCQHHSPTAPCDHTLHAGAAINGDYIGLPTNRAQLEWIAIAVPLFAGVPAINPAANRAPRDYHPPPPFRLYLHTQRLLI